MTVPTVIDRTGETYKNNRRTTVHEAALLQKTVGEVHISDHISSLPCLTDDGAPH